MNAMLIVKTTNGYAAMPYTGDIPTDALTNLRIATKLDTSYASGAISLVDVLSEYFEPEEAPELSSLKEA